MTVSALNMRMNPAATYISCCRSALNNTGPDVGKFKTMATMTSPATNWGNMKPIPLINGFIA
jgi:hypothetical protein